VSYFARGCRCVFLGGVVVTSTRCPVHSEADWAGDTVRELPTLRPAPVTRPVTYVGVRRRDRWSRRHKIALALVLLGIVILVGLVTAGLAYVT
jgi:hypothetical protein